MRSVRAEYPTEPIVNVGARALLRGRSGSGKSTFINILTGVDIPNNGEIKINGNIVDFTNEEVRTNVQKEIISLQFQNLWLNEYVNVYNQFTRDPLINMEEKRQLFKELIDICSIEPFLNEELDYLSGGELQRVALVKTLLRSTPITILDEPTSRLDYDIKKTILNYITSNLKKLNIEILIITSHDDLLLEFTSNVINFPL